MTDDIQVTAEKIRARGESAPFVARDPVNVPTMNTWLDALGDENPIYVDADAARAAGHEGLVAPPAMIQVWTMPGLGRVRDADDPLWLMITTLTEAGYPSIVATDCEQTYHRYLRPGELVTVRSRLGDVTGPKQTALGEGWFVTTHNTWYVDDEPVAEMKWRVLKFKPHPKKPKPSGVLRPVISKDTEFFWAGTAARELRIQRCDACGTLRHPPGPFCMACGGDATGFVVASGRGTVFSYVVHHHPPVPGRQTPYVVALVELEEGVRMLGEVVDVVAIGDPVEVVWQPIDDELTLPAWRSA